MAVLELLLDFFRNSVLAEVVLSMGPLWVSVMVGIFIGWLWKPKWVSLGGDDKSANFERPSKLCSSPSSLSSDGFGFPALGFSSIPGLNLLKARGFGAEVLKEKETCSGVAGSPGHDRSLSEKENVIVGMEDFHYLHQLVDVKDGGSSWIPMMDRSMGNMSYQAWRRDPPSGPPQYRSRTVFEDATPELVRDFFWDDEFRAKWDDMLIYSSTLEEYPATGTMVVHWIRKFPFFCSDREYIIGRRIWDSGRSYYCVTKGVPSTTIPRRNKPKRVDLYYSSWCIRAVESRRGDGQLTACEVLLFHYEDMGIPWEIAKLGVRQGMWGAVKKIEPGVRAYQMARRSSAQLSRSAIMAQINTMINPNYLGTLETKTDDSSEVKTFKSPEREKRRNISKILVVGGVVILACSLDRGLLTKAVIFGVARRFGMLGRRL